jgi:DHA2 family multidrug resistance protein
MKIVNVSLLHIAGSMAAAPNEGTLVITFFAVAQAIMLPLTGWLATRFGTVRMFLFSIVGFAVTSLMCGLAQNLPMLIVFRILQGVLSGPLMPLSQAILMQTTPQKQVPTALSFWSTTVMTGPVAGPLLGGFFSDAIGWEWCFFINVPIGAAAFIVAARVLPKYEQPVTKLPVDYVGLGLMILWIGAAQFVLDFGKDYDWFSSPLILLVSGAAIVGLVAFVFWEVTEKHPIVDLGLFRNRNFTITMIAAAVAMSTQFASVVIVPLWIQTALGFTASASGMLVATTGILAFGFTPWWGVSYPRWIRGSSCSAACSGSESSCPGVQVSSARCRSRRWWRRK